MRFKNVAIIRTFAVFVLVTACTPALNWREVPISATSLVAMFPCEPREASNRVALGGQDVELHMTGCDTSGLTAAVGHAKVADPGLIGPVLAQWRMATLASAKATTTGSAAFRPQHASDLPQSLSVQATGFGPDGRPVRLQGAWFARGTEVFMALVYADTLTPDTGETFSSGLRFR